MTLYFIVSVKKQTIAIINLLLLIIISSIDVSATGQTQETQSKINTTDFLINASDVKQALNLVHNNTMPHYVKL